MSAICASLITRQCLACQSDANMCQTEFYACKSHDMEMEHYKIPTNLLVVNVHYHTKVC